jgi:tetratricopeptide (TPR) repeat protein
MKMGYNDRVKAYSNNFAAKVLLMVACVALVASQCVFGAASTSASKRSLARIYMSNGNYDKALPLAEQALYMEIVKGDNEEQLAWCYGDIAYIYMNMGHLKKAANACNESLRLQKLAYFDTHPYIAYTLKTLSGIQREQRDFQSAKDSLDQAISIMLETNKVDNQTMAPFYVEYAKIYCADGNYEQSLAYYNKSMKLINASYGKKHLYTAYVMNGLAELHVWRGDYDEASKTVSAALAIQERIYGSEHHLLAPAWLIQASIRQGQGNDIEAAMLMQKAITVVSKTGDENAVAMLNNKIEKIKLFGQESRPVLVTSLN